ncbi:DUF6580 family putative transport protein [Nanoarchaeota archaeon]
MFKKKQESKEKQKLKQKSALSVKERIALKAVQLQLQNIQLKEYIMMASFIMGAALLRVPMQAIPSAEPLTFFAILGGWMFGRNKGAVIGAGSLIMSNFYVMGGQGPWSPFQALSFGAAGFLGGFLRKNARWFEVVGITILATLTFEIIMNVYSGFFFGGRILLAFLSALPFIGVHLVSNTMFSFLIPITKKVIYDKTELKDKSRCKELIQKINSRITKIG